MDGPWSYKRRGRTWSMREMPRVLPPSSLLRADKRYFMVSTLEEHAARPREVPIYFEVEWYNSDIRHQTMDETENYSGGLLAAAWIACFLRDYTPLWTTSGWSTSADGCYDLQKGIIPPPSSDAYDATFGQ